MEYQQPPRYMRPPPPPHAPPSASDPYQRPPAPVPPPQSNNPWTYSTSQQFQYHPQPQHSPSPPTPQWGATLPPPHSSEHTQYAPPPPPPPPYPTHQPPHYSSHPHLPPIPPRPLPMPQSYGQDWGNGSWSHHQNWDYSTNNNEEDWGAKARAWAAAKAVPGNQHPQSQFMPAVRPEDQNHYHSQFSQSSGPQFRDAHTPLVPSSMYQQYLGTPDRTGLGQHISSGQTSHGTDVLVSYAARDGSLTGDSQVKFPPPEKSSTSPSVSQKEVPSSYSSISAGHEEAEERYEKFNSPSSMLVASIPQHHVQPQPPAGCRSGWMEEPHQVHGSQQVEPVPDLSDQPLNFAPHFNRDLDPHARPNYIHSSGGPPRGLNPTGMSSSYSWPHASAPGVVYPSVPPMLPPAPPADLPVAMPTPASGHSVPMFPAGFQPTAPVIGPSFGVGAGVPPHPPAFLGDSFGVPTAERPKKAPVPNWLREEIIKNKAVITNTVAEDPKEDSQSIEDDVIDKSSTKGDQEDSRSIDSSRSDDEDEVDATRAAAINQEIKRVLTEVLLKVTDKLFDDIATKVLKEDDLSVEVGPSSDLLRHQELPSTSAILTPKAAAKVLIPNKTKECDIKESSEKSTSGSHGDILGLGYASDEEDGIQSSSKSKESFQNPHSFSIKISADQPAVASGDSKKETKEQGKSQTDGTEGRSPVHASAIRGAADMDSPDNRTKGEWVASDLPFSKRPSDVGDNELQADASILKSNKSVSERFVERNERSGRISDVRRSTDDDFRSHTTNRSGRTDRHEILKPSHGRDHKDSESPREKPDKLGDKHKRHEERRSRTEKTDHYDVSRDKTNDKDKAGGKNYGISQMGRDKRTRGKEDNGNKHQDRTKDERKDRSRHKNGTDSSRHKRRRSSSTGGRGRESKDNSVASYANDSSDEVSSDSKRKSHRSRRHKSPSPIRSRKRQVSRSPHTEHSKRRHSPYSSLEATRVRRSVSRSRSRSPIHRRR